jgi:hypothetical protein
MMAEMIVAVRKAKRTNQRIYFKILGVRVSFLINWSMSFSMRSANLDTLSLLVDELSSKSLF